MISFLVLEETMDKLSISRLMFACLVAAGILTGCGRGSSGKAGGQVVAKVNGDEITIHQVNAELSQMRPGSEDEAKKAGRRIAETLVDQQLLIQKARAAKLDRDPQIVQALERAQRQILAQAYMTRATTGAAPPSKDEVRAYYKAHPEIFEKRRVYHFEELVVDKSAPQKELEAKVKSAKSMKEVVEWLKSRNITATMSKVVRAAEQIPSEILPKLSGIKPGQAAAIVAPRNIVIVHMVAVEERPLSEAVSAPAIERYLLNTKRDELLQAELKRLRESAAVEYLGEFAVAAAAAEATAAPPVKPKEASTERDKTIEKGLSVLR
jgi:EpsD family peptidyl-prolyl cis-trans isomerase